MLGARGRQILRDVKTAYADLYVVQQLIFQNQKIEGILKGLIQTAQSKLAVGEVMASDPIQAQGELAKLLVEREPLFEQKKTLEAKLNQLMARSSEEEIHLPSQVSLPHWNLKLEDSIEIASLRHPSVKLAEHNIGQKEWALKAAKREYLPDLNAQMEYVQRPGSAPNAWTGEFMINVPLLVKKKMKGVSQAEAELASARYSEVAVKNDVTFKVREIYARMLSADRVMKINQGTLIPQMRQALEVSALAYTSGKGNFLSYLTAARGLADAQMEYWKSYGRYIDSVWEMEEAVGATLEELSDSKTRGAIGEATVQKQES
jgi:outer membrane protein TolC